MPLTGVIGRLGARVLARRLPPARAGGLRLARMVAARHLPGGLAAAARLSRERVAVARGRRARPQQELPAPPGMSEFAARWIFGDGEIEGTPFAGGAAFEPESVGPPSFLARRVVDEPEQREPPPAVASRGPAARGRVEEVTAFRLSSVPAAPEEEQAPEPEQLVAAAEEAPQAEAARVVADAGSEVASETATAAPAAPPAPSAPPTPAAATTASPRPVLRRVQRSPAPTRPAVPVRAVHRTPAPAQLPAPAESRAITPASPKAELPVSPPAPGRVRGLLRRATQAVQRAPKAAPSGPAEAADEVPAEISERLLPDSPGAAPPGIGRPEPGPAGRSSEPRQRVALAAAQPPSGDRPRDVPASDDGIPRTGSGSRLVSRFLRRPAPRAEQAPLAPAPVEPEATAAERPPEPAARRPLARRLLRRAAPAAPSSPPSGSPLSGSDSPRPAAAPAAGDAPLPGEPLAAAGREPSTGPPAAAFPPAPLDEEDTAGRAAAQPEPAPFAQREPAPFELDATRVPLPRILRRQRGLRVAEPAGEAAPAAPVQARPRPTATGGRRPASRPAVRIDRAPAQQARGAGGARSSPAATRLAGETSAERVAAATGGAFAYEEFETESVTFPRPAGIGFASPPLPAPSAPAPAVARQADESPPAEPAAAPAPPAAPPAAAPPGGASDLDEIYEQVLGRLRRDLVAERERIGDLMGDLT